MEENAKSSRAFVAKKRVLHDLQTATADTLPEIVVLSKFLSREKRGKEVDAIDPIPLTSHSSGKNGQVDLCCFLISNIRTPSRFFEFKGGS